MEQFHRCSVCDPQIKLDEEKSKHAGLAQQNGFGPEFLEDCGEASERPVKSLRPREKSTNKYDLTIAPYF